MYYVYLLETVHGPPETYLGRMADLRTRLANHNAGSWPKWIN